MSKMSDQVRLFVGLENILLKARRRLRECEREEGGASVAGAARYRDLVARLSEEIQGADRAQLEEYLQYVEGSVLGRLGKRVEAEKEQMVASARRIVEGRARLHEFRHEFTDALDRIRIVRERLGRDPYKPTEIRFGLGTHGPGVDRHAREAHDLVKEYLKA